MHEVTTCLLDRYQLRLRVNILLSSSSHKHFATPRSPAFPDLCAAHGEDHGLQGRVGGDRRVCQCLALSVLGSPWLPCCLMKHSGTTIAGPKAFCQPASSTVWGQVRLPVTDAMIEHSWGVRSHLWNDAQLPAPPWPHKGPTPCHAMRTAPPPCHSTSLRDLPNPACGPLWSGLALQVQLEGRIQNRFFCFQGLFRVGRRQAVLGLQSRFSTSTILNL